MLIEVVPGQTHDLAGPRRSASFSVRLCLLLSVSSVPASLDVMLVLCRLIGSSRSASRLCFGGVGSDGGPAPVGLSTCLNEAIPLAV